MSCQIYVYNKFNKSLYDELFTYHQFDNVSSLLTNDLSLRFNSSSFQLFTNYRAAKQSKQKNLNQYKRFENIEKTRETIWSSACHFCWIPGQLIFKTSISLNTPFNKKLCQISLDLASNDLNSLDWFCFCLNWIWYWLIFTFKKNCLLSCLQLTLLNGLQ